MTLSRRVTHHVEQIMSPHDAHDPIARQYEPDEASESVILPDESADPIGDDAHSPVPGIVHRYPDRVLLKLTPVCAVHCRYCFRKEMIGPAGESLNAAELEGALDYIRKTPVIYEVILTGGDPFVLSVRQIAHVMGQLASVDHVKVIRIHTRVPVADPGRITDDLCVPLRRDKAVYVVIHINHAQEITADVESALEKLRAAGCVLLSQSVLLKGVNDSAPVLEDLFRRLTALRVKPYYLHHLDHAPGTSHFRVSIAKGQDIMRQLLGRLSGVCVPTYMLDIPGGHGKIPLTPCYISELRRDVYELTDFKGEKHNY